MTNAATAWRRIASAVRTVKRAIVRRSDAWLYGLDQQYPEYDAYRRRPRRLVRAIGAATAAVGSIAAVTVSARAVLARRWEQRPSTDRRTATSRRRVAAGHRAPTGRGVTPAQGGRPTAVVATPGGDLSDTPGSVADPTTGLEPVGIPSGPVRPRATDSVATSTATADTRHTSAIPSTFAPGAA